MFTLHRWIHGVGEGHPDPEIRRGARSQIFFSALRASVRSTNKSRGGEGRGGEGRGR